MYKLVYRYQIETFTHLINREVFILENGNVKICDNKFIKGYFNLILNPFTIYEASTIFVYGLESAYEIELPPGNQTLPSYLGPHSQSFLNVLRVIAPGSYNYIYLNFFGGDTTEEVSSSEDTLGAVSSSEDTTEEASSSEDTTEEVSLSGEVKTSPHGDGA